MDFREWRNKNNKDKTWAKFQKFFQKAHNKWDQHSKKSSVRTRYGQANTTTSTNPQLEEATIAALANFATSTASDRATLSKLTETVQVLTAELKTARQQIDLLKKQGMQRENGKGRGSGNENRDPNTASGNKHYCFTHGFCCDHPGFMCPAPVEAHRRNATAKNTTGRSTDKLDEHLQRMAKRNRMRK